MHILPEDYGKIDLSKSERLFERFAERDEDNFGYFLLHINPSMQDGEKVDTYVCEEGVLFFRFFDNDMQAGAENVLPILYKATQQSREIILEKLVSNKLLLGNDGKLKFSVIYLLVFPELSNSTFTENVLPNDIRNHIVTKEDLKNFKHAFHETALQYLNKSAIQVSIAIEKISEDNINSILQRIAPEYTTVRIVASHVSKGDYTIKGADGEQLIVTDDDIAVRAYRLDTYQINIVNKMLKGDQLILACAGSGKSVLLISKCFKAARMNPKKRFLITCYNKNLRNLYVWFIERAGLQERNVDCLTFDGLCAKLLQDNNLPLPCSGPNFIAERELEAITAFNRGLIKTRYYGVFIDEVQIFQQNWYKLCFSLLENSNNNDHIFVICGDKTQNVEKLKKHGKAPWNAGPGYPNFRGGNKSVRIEKNYRNCIEVNFFINSYAECSKKLLKEYTGEDVEDPDIFLRGKSVRKGIGVEIGIGDNYAKNESLQIIKKIRYIHDVLRIPYDEIAIIMAMKQYKPNYYYIADQLLQDMQVAGLEVNNMANTDSDVCGRYGKEGVSLVTIRTSLGLDYRAVILCGLMPLGSYEKAKNPKPGKLSDEQEANLRQNIRLLYVACSRAKDYLYIQLPDNGTYSVYSKLLIESYKNCEGARYE